MMRRRSHHRQLLQVDQLHHAFLGQREEAIRSLAKADAWFATHAKEMPTPAEVTPRSRDAKPADLVIPLTLSDWLEAHVLRREAAELIKGPVATAKK